MQKYTLSLERPNNSAFFSREILFCRAHTFFCPCGAHPYSARAVRPPHPPTSCLGSRRKERLSRSYFMHITTNKGRDRAHNLKQHIFFAHQFFSIDLETFRCQRAGVGGADFENQLLPIDQQQSHTHTTIGTTNSQRDVYFYPRLQFAGFRMRIEPAHLRKVRPRNLRRRLASHPTYLIL